MTNSIQHRSRDLVLVLGPHRSGSSITTKLLESLGCTLGNELLGAEPANPIGHFENLKVLNYNESLLQRAGTDWKNPRPLAGNKFFQNNRAEVEAEINILLGELIDNEQVTALKEPRISILLDLWKPALTKQLDELKIVLTIRHPSEVAMSLNRRDRLNTIIGLQLWGKAMLNGLRFARELPNFFLFYEELVENSIDITADLSNFLNGSESSKDFVNPAIAYVQPDFRHNKVPANSLSALKVTSEIYSYVRNVRQATIQNFPLDLLDQWENRLNDFSLELDGDYLIISESQQLDNLTAERDAVTAERDAVTAERDAVTAERDAVTESKIWKITAPYRALKRKLKDKYLNLSVTR